MQMHDLRPVIVAGTGPAGLIAALAMADTGLSVTLVGPRANTEDRRTTALMAPALDFLAHLGIDAGLGGQSAPLRAMRIIDGTKRLIRSPTVTFHASEIEREEFGRNLPNSALLAALEEAVGKRSTIERRAGMVQRWQLSDTTATAFLDDGSVLEGQLVIAADGRDSPARTVAGIRTVGRDLPQSALVLNFEHSRPHGQTSNELHTETGPFTQVPLPGDRSSLVWVVAPEEAERLKALDDAALSDAIEARMHAMLGHVSVLPGRQVYPLSMRMPMHFARNRVALVGEAAHVFPPIGAQGLNLGLRDIETLAAISGLHPLDPGADSVTAAYDRQRRPDILARNGAVSLLNHSLLSGFLPAQMARNAGLSLLERSSPLRSLFMREGMAPGSAWGGAFSSLREKVRRKHA